MLSPSARLLQLLSLLQSRREWSGADLAAELDVDVRTLRRDVGKLRQLGYPVHAVPGAAGGYRLGAGAKMPPLLLDDAEAVAAAVGLRTAAGGSVAGIEASSLRALSKLEQVLPPRLRREVAALQSVTVSTADSPTPVDSQVLTVIALAARECERLRFGYRAHDGVESVRNVEPYRLTHTGQRWYLTAFDVDRQDWRNFRVDRMQPRTPTGPVFHAREVPQSAAPTTPQPQLRYRGKFTLFAPAAEVTEHLSWFSGVVEAQDVHSCTLYTESNWLEPLAIQVASLGVDFQAHEPPELVDYIAELADRLTQAASY